MMYIVHKVSHASILRFLCRMKTPAIAKYTPNALHISLRMLTLFHISDIVKDLGPVVQSIVSLTSSLRGQLVKCLTTL